MDRTENDIDFLTLKQKAISHIFQNIELFLQENGTRTQMKIKIKALKGNFQYFLTWALYLYVLVYK